MITDVEDFRKWLDELNPDEKMKMINPDTEEKFFIDADTREIFVPDQFKPDSVIYRDHNSETIYFKINKYFDKVNFQTKTCIIQYINANKDKHVHLVDSSKLYTVREDGEDYVIIPWELTSNVTEYEGPVTFSVRFYSVTRDGSNGTKVLDYNWSTKPCVINIGKGLYITDSNETLPNGTQLEELMDWMNRVIASGVVAGTVDYTSLKNKPSINGIVLEGNLTSAQLNITGSVPDNVLTKEDIDKALNIESENPVTNKVVTEAIGVQGLSISQLMKDVESLQKDMEDMTFIPIEIVSFLNSANSTQFEKTTLLENGSTCSEVGLKWELSKIPKNLSIIGPKGEQRITSLNTSGETRLIGQSLSQDATYTLKTEEKETTVTKETYIKFCNGIYSGAAPETEISDTFITSLKKTLTTTKEMICDINAGADQYIYIAVPSALGIPTFRVGGFDGGFIKVETDYQFTNSTTGRYKTEYNIFRSVNKNLGQTKVILS